MSKPIVPYVVTASGRLVEIFSPKVDDISIDDIATGLSKQNRFMGLTKVPYTIAQHCLICSKLVSQSKSGNAIAALLHDASEAYIQDIISPIKQVITGYDIIEDNLMNVIRAALMPDVDWSEPDVVEADVLAFRHEVTYITLNPEKYYIDPLPELPVIPELVKLDILGEYEAKALFLERFEELKRNLKK